MVRIASLSLLCLVASVALALLGWGSPVAVIHLALAAGILPLILAAMMHFIPVLTRTGDTHRQLAKLPFIAQAAGLLAVAGMQGWISYHAVYTAAAIDVILALLLLRWMHGRVRAALGPVHPGWRWYAVALICLIVALCAMLLTLIWPEYWLGLKRFHLHLNTLGLVGMAALGTLPLLLPTALGQPDPDSALWLRRRLWLVASGALMIAAGAAIAWPFAAPGAALLLVAALGLAGQWMRRFGLAVIGRDGAASSLFIALVGLLIALTAGLLHGTQILAPQIALPLWGIGFLLPLVTGALTHLLPVWRLPGPTTPARAAMRARLAATGQLRGLLFAASALALIAELKLLSAVLLAGAMLLFVIAVVQAVHTAGASR